MAGKETNRERGADKAHTEFEIEPQQATNQGR